MAWEFISKVSLIAQGLGLHSKLSMAGETSEDRRRKSYLFWRIYALEKALSLRLVRASTIRDHDVTIPKPEAERRPVSVLQSRSINWIDEAGLYGRLYDDLFSPSSLALPMPTRLALARALASDWEHIFVKREEYYVSYIEHGGFWSLLLDLTRCRNSLNENLAEQPNLCS